MHILYIIYVYKYTLYMYMCIYHKLYVHILYTFLV